MLSAANTHDSMLFEPLLDTNPTVRGHHGRAGRPRCRPDKLHADKGYDYRRCRRYLTRRGIKVRIARRGIEDKSRLGRVRWVVERTISWLLRFKRLGLRYDRTERTTLALLTLACTVINVRRLIKIELCDQVQRIHSLVWDTSVALCRWVGVTGELLSAEQVLGSARGPRHHEGDRSPGGGCSRVADGTIDGDERALSSGSDQPSVGPPLQRRSMRSACGPRSL